MTFCPQLYYFSTLEQCNAILCYVLSITISYTLAAAPKIVRMSTVNFTGEVYLSSGMRKTKTFSEEHCVHTPGLILP